ncbi:MAG: MFS transporter [Streptosporangiales bacterium]|nr:MFS transporter [Streptosporangiales bacterium]
MRVASIIDDAPVTAFHRRLALFSAGGPFLDGFALAVVGLAFITMQPSLALTPTEVGVIGSAALAGIFVGGAVFGYVTDRVGRRVMYLVDLVVLVVASLASALVTDAWQLVALRFLLGVAIGADYPIASSLLVEFLPRRQRGRYLGALFVVWAAGAAAAALVGWALSPLGESAWRLMLASPAVFGVLTVMLRTGTPESPRWLLSKGRGAEAAAVLRQVYGHEVTVDQTSDGASRTSYRKVFRRPYLRRTIFVSVFFSAHVIPLFAVYTFGPDILLSFGLPPGSGIYVAEAVIGGLFLLGGAPGLLLVDRIGRKSLLLWTFVVMAVLFGLMAAFQGASPALLLVLLCAYAVVSGSCNFIEIIYPNELFPTDIRATATGIVTAASRLGSAISTFMLPVMLTDLGAGATMLFLAVVNAVGFLVTVTLGVETKGRPLDETSSERVDSSAVSPVPRGEPVADEL